MNKVDILIILIIVCGSLGVAQGLTISRVSQLETRERDLRATLELQSHQIIKLQEKICCVSEGL